MERYCKRTWLNREDSPSTGNVVCFDGVLTDTDNTEYRSTFIAISDCYNSARLHKTHDDSIGDFIGKLERLRNEIDSFINHLNTNNA